ncbi:hypothetical protein [Lapidilactobacillus luobeiensis]|uniref:hypothetical protein n=1 Tax=Lapidilactobacillus luobeiensis TaxID=2950371 RepID=UPI0021C34B94|nr:hypothetical protein [Lapidilactobacillus luobeiensis]
MLYPWNNVQVPINTTYLRQLCHDFNDFAWVNDSWVMMVTPLLDYFQTTLDQAIRQALF